MTKSDTGMRGVLELVKGSWAVEGVVKLGQYATIFGREKADVLIHDMEVSATHFQVQLVGDSYHVFDMNSSNGTFLNDKKIIKARLADKDVIRVGQTQLRFAMMAEKQVRSVSSVYHAPAPKPTSIVHTLIGHKTRPQAAVMIDVTYGSGESEQLMVRKPEFYIGRASGFGRFDSDPELSRKHLLVKLNNADEIFIEDQQSTNGTYINGKKLVGLRKVTDKDDIKVGLCLLRIYPAEKS